MSVTVRVKTTQTMKIVVSSDLIASIVAQREEARGLSVEKVASFNGRQRYVAEILRSERTDEEVLKVIFKDSIIAASKEQAKEFQEDGIRVKGLQTIVEFPEVPTQGCSNVCTCGPKETCSKCPGKRWTETV